VVFFLAGFFFVAQDFFFAQLDFFAAFFVAIVFPFLVVTGFVVCCYPLNVQGNSKLSFLSDGAIRNFIKKIK
jgi:hypothetical protein